MSNVPYPVTDLDEVGTCNEVETGGRDIAIRYTSSYRRNISDNGNFSPGKAQIAIARMRQESQRSKDDDFFVEVIQSKPVLQHQRFIPPNKVADFSRSYLMSSQDQVVQYKAPQRKRVGHVVKIRTNDKIRNPRAQDDSFISANGSRRKKFFWEMKLALRRSLRFLDDLLEGTHVPLLMNHKTFFEILFIMAVTWQLSIFSDQLAEAIKDICQM